MLPHLNIYTQHILLAWIAVSERSGIICARETMIDLIEILILLLLLIILCSYQNMDTVEFQHFSHRNIFRH